MANPEIACVYEKGGGGGGHKVGKGHIFLVWIDSVIYMQLGSMTATYAGGVGLLSLHGRQKRQIFA